MRERPIIFTGESVRGILAGTKTQSRRLLNLKRFTTPGCLDAWQIPGLDRTFGCPYGSEDEEDLRLWVKETFRPATIDSSSRPHGPRIYYKADYPFPDPLGALRYKSPLYMKREQSRITIELTNVRLEKLQDITEEDAIAEGIRKEEQAHGEPFFLGATHPIKGTPKVFYQARQAFETLWDAINRKRAPWSENPWVWTISFRKVAA